MITRKRRLYEQRHRSLDPTAEHKQQSEYIWATRTAKVLLVIGIFGLAASSFAASPDTINVNSFDSNKPALAQAKAFNKKLNDKVPKYRKLRNTNSSLDQAKSIDKTEILHDVKERSRAIKAAMRSNPDKVIEADLPPEIKSGLPDEAKGFVEQTAEVVGYWRTGHYDSLTGDSKLQQRFAMIATDQGTNDYVYGKLPEIESGKIVKVTAIKLDNELALGSGKIEAKTNQKNTSAQNNILSLASSKSIDSGVKLAQAAPTPDQSWQICNNITTSCYSRNGPINLDNPGIISPTDRKVLVVPIRYPDSVEAPVNPLTLKAYSPGELTRFFDGNSDSVAEYYRRNSSGKLLLTAKLNSDWLTLTGHSSSECMTGAPLDDAVHEFIKSGRINIAGYTNIAYLINDDPSCKHGGMIGCATGGSNVPGLVEESWYWLNGFINNTAGPGSTSPPQNGAISGAFEHELGHNFGLTHTHLMAWRAEATDEFNHQEDREGGHHYDIMGSGRFPYSTHLTAFHKWELGWLKLGDDIQNITQSGTYNISPIEGASGVRGLRIPVEYDGEKPKARPSIYPNGGLRPPSDQASVTKAIYLEYRKPGVDGVFDNFSQLPNLAEKDYNPVKPGVLIDVALNNNESRLATDENAEKGESPLSSNFYYSTGYTYRYRTVAPSTKDAISNTSDSVDTRLDICVTINDQSSATASVTISFSCGATSVSKPLDGTINDDYDKELFIHDDAGKNDSGAACIDNSSHQLFVPYKHRVFEYDITEPGKSETKEPDHVLGADSVGSYVFYGSPVKGIDQFTYSARWTGKLVAPNSGRYQFTTYSDDGVRLWINGKQIINNWTDHSPKNDLSPYVDLVKGVENDIKLEYYNNYGDSTLQLKWTGPNIFTETIPQSAFTPPGMHGTYYDNAGKDSSGKVLDFNGKAITKDSPNIDNPWGLGDDLGTAYADINAAPSIKSINWNVTSVACDEAHHRLFVAMGEPNNGASRVLIFDYSKGITNGMNASYVLGQKDFTSAAKRNSIDYSGNFYKSGSNVFYPNQVAYSSRNDTLFISQFDMIPRILAFDLTNISNGMNATYVIGKKTGDFTSIPSNVAKEPFGQPYGLAVDEVNNRLFISSKGGPNYTNPVINIVDIANAKVDGLARLNTINLFDRYVPDDPSSPYLIPGSLSASKDGNTLYELIASGAYSTATNGVTGRGMYIINVRPGTSTNPSTLGPIAKSDFSDYSVASSVALDTSTNTVIIPSKNKQYISTYNPYNSYYESSSDPRFTGAQIINLCDTPLNAGDYCY